MHVTANLKLPSNSTLQGRIVNLGLGGAAVETVEYVHVGARIELEMQPPNLWDPLVLHATVSWVRETADGFLIGLAFEHESSRATGSLLGLLTAEAYS